MPKLSQLELEKFLLRKLLSDRYVGAHQTLYDNAMKYVPTHARGDLRHALDALIRQGFLLTKHKHYGVHVSINPEKLGEIKLLLSSAEGGI